MSKILDVSHVYKDFYSVEEERNIINDITFSVEEGEILVLLGPSGCGKSTILNMISGLLEPTSGEINTYNKKYPEHFIIDSSCEKICRAAALHDVGKISISDTILNKKGRLTDEEMEIMKTHTTKGYEIIRGFRLNDDEEQERYSLDIAKYHHERWDGKGYPEGLQGDAIPLWSQIVGIVDVYDALVSPRVYKKAFSHEKAMEMILAGECGTFNPILLECLKDAEELLKNEYK